MRRRRGLRSIDIDHASHEPLGAIIHDIEMNAYDDSMANLSLRGVDPATLASLKALAASERISVNTLILRLIDQGIGKATNEPSRRRRHDDLDDLAGAWSAEQAAAFDAATAPFREIEPALWK
jgi:hypothetical protein